MLQLIIEKLPMPKPIRAFLARFLNQKEEHSIVGHIAPLSLLVVTFGALIVLTVFTVAVAQVDLGKLNLWVALFVAFTKATLVILYFMHMRYDKPLNGIFFISSLLFVTLFIGLALTDTKEYQPDIEAYVEAQP